MRFALWGRSNVGKSSLINALTRKKSAATTSKNPGCTRSIDTFALKKGVDLVDLPGYGYASVSRTKSARWNQEIRAFLLEEADMTFLLLDGRHGVMKTDREQMEWLRQIPFRIILTKSKAKEATKNSKRVGQQMLAVEEEFSLLPHMKTDSKESFGMDVLRSTIENFVQQFTNMC